ncbi:MAG TPA: hypothetical protein VLY23_17430 [Candidatus Acidoferrum sp.]|nr:hypothetical protein [Candidatus Acidoferrum sp.]
MPSRNLDVRTAFVFLALAACLAAAGCIRNKAQAAAPVMVAPRPEAERPMNVAPDTSSQPPMPPPEPAPALAPDSSAPPLSMILKSKPPAPPRPAAEERVAETVAEQPAHAPVPQISPQLSPTDQQIYERKTNDEISAAEKNLEQANGRQLNAGQQDLVEKIRSFLDQSRDASKSSDWARAQNLAQKARLLSVELVNSL